MMNRNDRKFTLLFSFLLLFLLLGACTGETTDSTGNTKTAAGESLPVATTAEDAATAEPSDLIARVENQQITYGQINTMMNSSAMVGLSIPALGTPERHEAFITLLDKVISANLLYLDAKDSGTDKLPQYQRDIRRFEDAVIASTYRSKVMIGEIPVSDDEIEAYYEANIDQEVEFSDDVRLAIEAKLRKQQLQELETTLGQRLRYGVSIEIDTEMLKTANSNKRKDEDVIVRIDEGTLTWGDIKDAMRGADYREQMQPFTYDSDEERMLRLQSLIDEYLLVTKGRAAGLADDPAVIRRTGEYRKTHLINLHRKELIKSWQPTEEQLRVYFEAHRDSITIPEARKVQMVVVNTREEAEAIKKKVDSGEITMYQAAQQYSIVPDAKQTLGDIGWVTRGSGFPELDEYTFFLEPEEVGGPVQSPAGWHLVKVLDVRDAQLQNLGEPQTRKETLRRYMKEQQDQYVVVLRENNFSVEVDNENLHRLFQEEADWIARLTEKAKQEGSLTQERLKDMQKWITP